jgi:hypothetical protein
MQRVSMYNILHVLHKNLPELKRKSGRLGVSYKKILFFYRHFVSFLIILVILTTEGFIFYLTTLLVTHFVLGRMTEQWIAKRVEWSYHGLIYDTPSMEGLRKTTEHLSQDILYLVRDSNRAAPEHTSEALPLYPTRTLSLLPALSFASL